MIRTLSFLAVVCILFCTAAHAHTSEPEKVKCPIDGTEFTINVTMSYTTFGRYLDFEKTGAIGDLYESYINSCPKCHYSGYKSDFDTTYNDATKQAIRTIISPYKNSKMTDVLENEVAAEIHKYFHDHNDDIANIYLIASYFVRSDTGQLKQLRISMQDSAITYLRYACNAGEYETKKQAVIFYLIGDLYRRMGEFDKAIKYYDEVLYHDAAEDWVKKMTEEQKKLALKKDDDNGI